MPGEGSSTLGGAQVESKRGSVSTRKAKAKAQAARHKSKTKRVPAENTLLAEQKLMAAAQLAIRNKDYPKAQALLNKHQREFPKGIFSPERLAAQAIAMCLAGEKSRGQKAAAAFLKAHKSSPLAQRVRSSCTTP